MPVPSPAGQASNNMNFLSDVSCTAADNCWATGAAEKLSPGSIVIKNLLLHWTGKKWFVAAVPNPAGTKSGAGNSLASVRCTSPSDCWAAGSDGADLGGLVAARMAVPAASKLFFSNQMLHWNGKVWANVKVPNPAGTAKEANNELSGLSCTASTDCWAVGVAGTFNDPPDNTLNAALHWTGKKWFKVSVPNPAGTGDFVVNQLNAVNCVSASACWAVGTYGIGLGGNPSFAEVLRWNGARWSKSMIPNPAGTGPNARSTLRSIRCQSASDCWAVGSEQADSTTANLILHWTGKKWIAVS